MVLGASVIALALTGCSDDRDDSDATGSRNIWVGTIEVEGKPLGCVAFKKGYAGGLSCNWDAYNEGD